MSTIVQVLIQTVFIQFHPHPNDFTVNDVSLKGQMCLSSVSSQIEAIKEVIGDLKDTYDEAKSFFLEIFGDAKSLYNWAFGDDISHRTQSIEILVLNQTTNTTLNFVTDDDCKETYFRSGGNWYKTMVPEMTTLKTCKQSKDGIKPNTQVCT